MVIENPFAQKACQSKDQKAIGLLPIEKWKLANPVDRIGATVVDFSIILLPIILLLISPIKKFLMSSVLMQNEVMFMLSLSGIFLVALAIVVTYQTLFTAILGGTIGKRVFHLQVRNIWGDPKVGVAESFYRSLVWVLELILFLVPFLAILSDPKRRPLHDKIANTIVTTDRANVSEEPTPFEAIFAKTVVTSLLAIVFVLVLQNLFSFVKSMDSGDYFATLVGNEKTICDQVEWAMETWPRFEAKRNDARLHVALALFAAGEVDKSCLKKEISFFQSEQSEESPLAYLGQAFVYSSQPELSNKYLHRICEIEPYSQSCAMAKIVENWSDSNWTDVDLGFMSLGATPPVHMSIWAIRHYTKQRQFEKAASFIDFLSPQKALSVFLSFYRIKVLWGLHRRSEVRVVADTALENLPIDERIRVASWMCEKEFRNENCAAFQTGSCRVLQREVETSVETLVMPEVALLSVLDNRCSGAPIEEMKFLADTHMSIELRKFIEAMDIEKTSDSKAKQLYTELILETKLSPQLKLQTQVELARLLSVEELKTDIARWKQQELSEEWAVIGSSYMQRLNREGLFREAYNLGRLLNQKGIDDDFVLKPMAVSLYHLGDQSKAKSIVAAIFRRNPVVQELPANTNERVPASVKKNTVNMYDQMVTHLKVSQMKDRK